MPLKVGIPRALLFYYYYPLWRVFFEELGAEVVPSPPSTKGVLTQGLKNAVDEACLPVKMAFGHVLSLAGKVDYIFLPRLVSLARREYICPKFLGLPDMARRLDGLPPLIDVNIDLYRRNGDAYIAAREVGRLFTGNSLKIWLAYRRALKVHQKYFRLLQLGLLPGEALAVLEDRVREGPPPSAGCFTVALIGHPYNIYDPYASMNIVRRLRAMGANVVTAEHLSEKVVRSCAARLPKRLFWTLGQWMIGAAFHYMERPDVSGMVHVAAFGCGPDSMTGELIERRARAAGMPFLNLTLDEHTGEAGVVTRLEAFLDMVRWKKAGAAGM
ncbi:MAG: acyl-CoA dehydratase activase-related protein [Peptococcaceae bacterium]|nr:acyl-CoA dehydratase activase-related protein [Peptococcaceae bacterium]